MFLKNCFKSFGIFKRFHSWRFCILTVNLSEVNLSVNNRLCSTSQKRIEYVSKMSWRCLNNNSLTWWYVFKTSWRCFENIFPIHLEDVLNTSWICPVDFLKMLLLDVPKTSWKRLERILKRYEQGEYIRHDQDALNTSWWCLLNSYA